VIRVRVQPRASHEGIAGEQDGAIVIRVNAPPEGGRANRAVVKLVARRLGVAQSAVEVARGASSRDKVLRIDGVSDEHARQALLSDKRPPG
jgi:uncharacterized protein (TIGR00251 family)